MSGAAAARYAAWLGLDRYLLMELRGLRQGAAAAGWPARPDTSHTTRGQALRGRHSAGGVVAAVLTGACGWAGGALGLARPSPAASTRRADVPDCMPATPTVLPACACACVPCAGRPRSTRQPSWGMCLRLCWEPSIWTRWAGARAASQHGPARACGCAVAHASICVGAEHCCWHQLPCPGRT